MTCSRMRQSKEVFYILFEGGIAGVTLSRVGQHVATLQLCFLVGQLKHSLLCVQLLSQQ